MTKLNSLSLIAVTLFALFISVRGILTPVGTPARIFQILFAPVTVYLILRLARPAAPQSGNTGWVIYCLIVSALLVIIGLISAQTTAQLVSSLIFSPLVIYFFILVWPQPGLATHPAQRPHSIPSTIKLDIDRRNFLKIIGSAGLLALVYGLFAKRTDILFPETAQDSGQASSEPTVSSPTAGYLVSEIDDAEIAHFGFTNKLGQWYIMKQNADNSYRYAKGDRDFSSNWANRTSLKYDYFEEVF